MIWPWKRKPVESTPVKAARAERMVSEQRLREAKARREDVDVLAARVDHMLKVNGFGAAASAAMRRRDA